jgi:acyl-CoA synthetase (AMP-forming)/AMP-acid ligase II
MSVAPTLGDVVLRNLRLRRNTPAIIFEDRTLTHGEFAARAFRLVWALRRLGVGHGDRVAILAQNCPEYLETYAAGELGGWTTVPINYRLAAPEIAYIVGDSRPKILIVEPQLQHLVTDGVQAQLDHLITIGADGPDLSYERLIAAEDPEPPDCPATPDSIAWLIYTSGTTGRPKGVMLGHRGQVWAALVSALEMGVRPTDCVAVAMPLYHVGARNTCATRSLQGCPIVLHRAFRGEAFLASLARHKVTETLLAPTMLNDLLQIAPDMRAAAPSLAKVVYSAAPMPEALLRRGIASLGSVFAQVYGMTESGGPGCILRPHQHELDGSPDVVRRLRSAGQPMVGCDVRIVRPDRSECRPGEPGEIAIASPGIMRGYWNSHAATSDAIRNGWLHTGDVGEIDSDGFIYVVDRLKDMIISGGENIYSREVEEALTNHPAISEAAVVGVPDARWGEMVVAFVVKRSGADVTEETITEHCRRTIAGYKRPKRFHFVDALPRLPNGKIEKFKLREPFWSDQSRRA